MRAVLPLSADDFPPHIDELTVAHLTLFVLREDSFVDELTLRALRHTTVDGDTVEAGVVRTIGGVVGTRRAGGAPWGRFIGSEPVGRWELAIDDSRQTRRWFTDGLIDDIVMIFTLRGTAPPW
jgi:hypothetical protein